MSGRRNWEICEMTTYSTNTAPQHKTMWIGKLTQRVVTQTKTIEFRIMTIFLTALMSWVTAIVIFGYPALILVALTLVPIMFFLLMMITVGK
jgi:fatty acid desaturase